MLIGLLNNMSFNSPSAFNNLPLEVIEHILLDNSLHLKDVLNLSLCNKSLNITSNNKNVWRRLFHTDWPVLYKKLCVFSLASNSLHTNKTNSPSVSKVTQLPIMAFIFSENNNVFDINKSLRHSCVNEVIDWKDIYKHRFLVNSQVCKRLDLMSEYFYENEFTTYSNINTLLTDSSEPLYFDQSNAVNLLCILDSLYNIVHCPNIKNLTHHFYAVQSYRVLYHSFVASCFTNLNPNNCENLSLEQAACLFESWFSLDECINETVAQTLDDYATKIKKTLRTKHPNLKLASSASNHYLYSDVSLVFEEINQLLYRDNGYVGNSEDYYNVNNSFISHVIASRTGIPITLSVIYQSLAARLGITLEPVSFPMHFLTRYALSKNEHIYIDAFDGGECLTRNRLEARYREVPQAFIPDDAYKACKVADVLKRMCWNMIRIVNHDIRSSQQMCSALELLHILSPDESDIFLSLSRCYLKLQINPQFVVDGFLRLNLDLRNPLFGEAERLLDIETKENQCRLAKQKVEVNPLTELPDNTESLDPSDFVEPENPSSATKITEDSSHDANNSDDSSDMDNQDGGESDPDPDSATPKRRTSCVSYAVGMLMRHRKYDYECVIAGWDRRCRQSQQWVIMMGVHKLERKHEQPFYSVLVSDGSQRYAAQENLVVNFDPAPGDVTHEGVGRFFTRRDGNRYVPNVMTRRLYPDDTDDVIDAIIAKSREDLPAGLTSASDT